jgi:ferritin
MDKGLLLALINQINAEIYSSYLYLSMSSDMTHKGFSGFAHWFQIQAQEEMIHAMKLFNYVNERGEKVIMKSIKAPPTEWETPLQVFKATLAHEKTVSESMRSIYKIAREVFDPATEIFLNWFIMEQVEEEANAAELIQKLELADHVPAGILMLDKDLASRPDLITIAQSGE